MYILQIFNIFLQAKPLMLEKFKIKSPNSNGLLVHNSLPNLPLFSKKILLLSSPDFPMILPLLLCARL